MWFAFVFCSAAIPSFTSEESLIKRSIVTSMPDASLQLFNRKLRVWRSTLFFGEAQRNPRRFFGRAIVTPLPLIEQPSHWSPHAEAWIMIISRSLGPEDRRSA